jgi:hypothetical protein
VTNNTNQIDKPDRSIALLAEVDSIVERLKRLREQLRDELDKDRDQHHATG